MSARRKSGPSVGPDIARLERGPVTKIGQVLYREGTSALREALARELPVGLDFGIRRELRRREQTRGGWTRASEPETSYADLRARGEETRRAENARARDRWWARRGVEPAERAPSRIEPLPGPLVAVRLLPAPIGARAVVERADGDGDPLGILAAVPSAAERGV